MLIEYVLMKMMAFHKMVIEVLGHLGN